MTGNWTKILVATLISAVTLSYLSFFTTYWPGLLVFTGATVGCILICGLWIIIVIRKRGMNNSKRLKTSDYAKLSVFISLLIAVDFSLHYIPGWIWEFVPFASAMLYYLPAAAVAVAAIRTVSKPGAALILFSGYAVVSLIISPFLAWLPYYAVWAVLLETYFTTVDDYGESVASAILGGWVLGVVGAAFNTMYNWATLQWWTPLFLSVPNVFACASTSAVGAVIGARIGERARRISL